MPSQRASLPIDLLRAETRGAATRIFLNNAGASLQPDAVVERVIAHLRREQEIGGYEAADAAKEELAQVYASVATLLHARPEEIALVESATRAWDMVFYGLPWKAGDVVVTAPNEYASNYIAFLQVQQRYGVRVTVMPTEDSGAIDLGALEETLSREPRTRLIALTHVPTNNGRVQPAASVGALARRHGVPFLLDACQSAGQVPLDVDELGCDLLSAAGRKYLRGPRGTGFLYVRQSLLDHLQPPMLDMHAADWTSRESFRMRPDAKRFEVFEYSAACRLGLGVAVRYALALGLAPIQERVSALGQELRAHLARIPGVTVRDLGWETGAQQCGIVTFTHDRFTAKEVERRMAAQRIVLRTSDRGSTLLDMTERRLEEVVRASVHYYNTEDELARFVAALGQL